MLKHIHCLDYFTLYVKQLLNDPCILLWLFFSPFFPYLCIFNYHSLLLFSHSVVPNSLQPHGLQHARLPCPSPSPRVCSNSCPFNWDAIQPAHLLLPPLLLPSILGHGLIYFSMYLLWIIPQPSKWHTSFCLNPLGCLPLLKK